MTAHRGGCRWLGRPCRPPSQIQEFGAQRKELFQPHRNPIQTTDSKRATTRSHAHSLVTPRRVRCRSHNRCTISGGDGRGHDDHALRARNSFPAGRNSFAKRKGVRAKVARHQASCTRPLADLSISLSEGPRPHAQNRKKTPAASCLWRASESRRLHVLSGERLCSQPGGSGYPGGES